MIVILDLFEGERLEWTLEDMQARLGYTRSTLYRYLKVLTDTGLLTSLPDVGYTLGPRIAELDYSMRERDPLISASRPVMAELVRICRALRFCAGATAIACFACTKSRAQRLSNQIMSGVWRVRFCRARLHASFWRICHLRKCARFSNLMRLRCAPPGLVTI